MVYQRVLNRVYCSVGKSFKAGEYGRSKPVAITTRKALSWQRFVGWDTIAIPEGFHEEIIVYVSEWMPEQLLYIPRRKKGEIRLRGMS